MRNFFISILVNILIFMNCLAAKANNAIKADNLDTFLILDLTDEHIEELIKSLKKQKRSIEDELTKRFLQYVEYEEDMEALSKCRKRYCRKKIIPDVLLDQLQAGNLTKKEILTILELSQAPYYDYFNQMLSENIKQIVSTACGRYLICRLIHILENEGKKIVFKRDMFGDGVHTDRLEEIVGIDGERINKRVIGMIIYVDVSHLHTSTGFHVTGRNNSLFCEKKAHPDVYIFHELIHALHYLEDNTIYEDLYNGKRIETIKFRGIPTNAYKLFPPAGSNKPSETTGEHPVDYEEMRTILGIPYSSPRLPNLCENQYRQERNLSLRVSLIADKDGIGETYPTYRMCLNYLTFSPT